MFHCTVSDVAPHAGQLALSVFLNLLRYLFSGTCVMRSRAMVLALLREMFLLLMALTSEERAGRGVFDYPCCNFAALH